MKASIPAPTIITLMPVFDFANGSAADMIIVSTVAVTLSSCYSWSIDDFYENLSRSTRARQPALGSSNAW